ncbi:hypothetical protein BACCIP111895_01051 [Neobacillus rhizosphaerae]|uniref:Uncharacterized protein n=1 Tax=Neobacillus rhizosphaerae TaxID=2880965 RepID=A0ABN8KN24_9BACI|nr:hypothetical protein [Neobacillus rhizosphaerae]CAH2713897.1 hypothetical protein BACCIP111895_01051 [Neobacillus rhizosphaerae]
MDNHDDDARNLEQLLESLIKMVGKANHNVDALQKRVSQLEWLIKEQQFELRERGLIRIYSKHPHRSSHLI